MTKRAPIDWEKVEREYRAAILSLREIGAANGCSHVAVAKKAKAEGWQRDLNAKIQAKADALVNKAAVSKEVTDAALVKDSEAVEAGALAIARIRIEHRTDITRMRTLVIALLRECETLTGQSAVFEELGEMLRSPDDKGMDRLNEAYTKVISLPQRIKGVKELSETLKVLIGLEREAYGLSSGDGDSAAQPLADALAGFVGKIHQAGAGRLQYTPRAPNA